MRSSSINRASVALTLAFVSGAAFAVPIAGQGTWQSTLQGRDLDGDATTFEAYYDTALNMTWLADANFAMTSGYDADGLMDWNTANTWATNLDVFGVTGWRLASETPLNGTTFDYLNLSVDGTTDLGWADGVGWVDAAGNPLSELANMFSVTLGNLSECAFGDWSCLSGSPQAGSGLTNTGPFSNLLASVYWSGATFTSGSLNGITFDMGTGARLNSVASIGHYAWAVRDGDVLAGPVTVPEPATAALLGAGLLHLVLARRRRRQTGSTPARKQ
jgi:hypothetical protein